MAVLKKDALAAADTLRELMKDPAISEPSKRAMRAAIAAIQFRHDLRVNVEAEVMASGS